jgi:hypothetical protein
MRLFVIIACLAIAVIVTLILLVWGGPSHRSESVPPIPSTPEETSTARPVHPMRQSPPNVNPELSGDTHDKTDEDATEQTIKTFGQEFEQKWYNDRERLGIDQHREMEKLWFAGRRPRGDPQAIARLEKLLIDYPDTNRAGCAAYELGHHYLRNHQLDDQERRRRAETYWRLVDERYPDTLCEYNAPANALSKLSLVTWIYRYTDQALARRLLEELKTKHAGETDHLGQPIDVLAEHMLEVMDEK